MRVALEDHAVVEQLDAFAARAPECERKECMTETGHGTEHHSRGKASSNAQVLEVGLTYRSRMLCEKTPYAHGGRA